MTPLMLLDTPSEAAHNEAARSKEEQADHLLVDGKGLKHGIHFTAENGGWFQHF